ncbi:MAG: aminotransferase class IV [Mangrovibacterium sp.]
MYLLLETLKFEQGKFYNLTYHQKRFNAARAKFFPHAPHIDLANVLTIPPGLTDGLYRCRIVYAEHIQQVDFIPQVRRQFYSLQVVYTAIDYTYKFVNRDAINELLKLKGNTDEIIIVKSGLVTDCSIGNLVFKKDNRLYTPTDPLLKGTQRQKLIEQGVLQTRSIRLVDLKDYETVGIINALIDLSDVSWIPVADIKK